VTAQLLYDADCAFCTRTAGYATRLGLQVRVIAMQTVDLESLGVSPTRAAREVPFVGPDGAVVYGHSAIAGALATGSAPFRLLARVMVLGVFDRLFARLYRWVADHRYRLPGGTAACELPAADA